MSPVHALHLSNSRTWLTLFDVPELILCMFLQLEKKTSLKYIALSTIYDKTKSNENISVRHLRKMKLNNEPKIAQLKLVTNNTYIP